MSYHKTFDVDMLGQLAFGGLEVFNYGDYAEKTGGLWQNGEAVRNNYGCHTMGFHCMGVTFYFSYETLIAFYHPDSGFCMRRNEWGVNTSSHMSTIRMKYASHLGSMERHEDLSLSEFNAYLYNLNNSLGLPLHNHRIDGNKRRNLPKFVFALKTGEIVDGKLADNPDDIRTPGRTRAKKEEAARERAKARRRKEGVKKAKATRKRRRARRLAEAEHERLQSEIPKDCFLQPEDLAELEQEGMLA